MAAKNRFKNQSAASSNYEGFLWEINSSNCTSEQLRERTLRILQDFPARKHWHYDIGFYPYVGLNSTLQIRKGKFRLRISDLLADAPLEVIEALIRLLMAQVFQMPQDEAARALYDQYIRQPFMEERHYNARMQRGRKKLTGPLGKFFDLNHSFDRVNQAYFSPRLKRPTLSWSPYRSRRRLGYHEERYDLIVISRWLDRRSVPVYVLDYVMYHEMLHIAIPPERKNARRIVHSKAFQEREKAFQQYDKAIDWLRRH